MVLPVLLLLVLGLMDWGYHFFVLEVVTNAAREASRTGTLRADTAFATTEAQAALNSYLSAAGLDPTKATSDIQVSGTAVGTGSSIVTVSYPTGSITGFLNGKLFTTVMPANAQATVTMRR